MKQEDFRKKAHSVLDEIVDYIAEIEKKADKASDDMKEEYNQKLKRLKEIKLDLTNKLEDYENITESRWEVVKESFSEFMDKVNKAWQDSYNKASSVFKKQ